MDFGRQREENIAKLLKKTREEEPSKVTSDKKQGFVEELTKDPDVLYKGIVLSEILGPPLSKKKRGR